MIQKLKAYYRKELFHPTILSIFINPFYTIRKRLLQSIKKFSFYMEGEFVDFGCGAMPYKNLFTVQNYRGIDLKKSGHDSSSMHKDVIYYDGKKIPLEDSSVDSIFSSEVFEHIFELDSTLLELNRILKTGGKLLITVPFVWEEHETPYDYARYSSYALKYILKKNNFEIINSIKSGSSIETCFQVSAAFLHSVFPRNSFFNIILTLIFIFPINLLTIFFNIIFPKGNNLYLNNVMLARKI